MQISPARPGSQIQMWGDSSAVRAWPSACFFNREWTRSNAKGTVVFLLPQGEGGRRPDEGENPRMLFCKSNAFSLSPALSRGRGSWEHRPSTFLVRCSILVICRSMVELLAYGRGEFHLAPNQKQNGARWNLPSRIFWRAPKTKKRPSRVGGSLKECAWITTRAGT